MADIDTQKRELILTIVYHGCTHAGKTTNLQVIRAKAPQNSVDEWKSEAVQTDRQLSLNFRPPPTKDLEPFDGLGLCFKIVTIPGACYYESTRKACMETADAIVFVVHSSIEYSNENEEQFNLLLELIGRPDRRDMPVVLQLNHRDSGQRVYADVLRKAFGREKWPVVEAIANKGDGVFQTLKTACISALAHFRSNYDGEFHR